MEVETNETKTQFIDRAMKDEEFSKLYPEREDRQMEATLIYNKSLAPKDNIIEKMGMFVGTMEKAFKGEKGDRGSIGEKGNPGERGEKGDRGEKGRTPQKGLDYFTQEEIQHFKQEIEKNVKIPAPQVIEKTIKEYYEKDLSIDDMELIINEVMSRVSANEMTPEDIKKSLSSLKGDKRLDAKAIKNIHLYARGGGGSGSSSSSGGGAVSSVFGRTGDVIAVSGDYTKLDVGLGNVDNTSDVNKPVSTAAQTALDTKVDENAAITGATKTKITYDAKGLVTAGADIAATDLPTGIDAIKIADGSISNTEFQYLNNVSSNIQTQLGNKQNLNSTLTSLAAYNTNGFVVQTAADTFAGRAMATGSSKVTIANGNGVSGNPTFDLGTVTPTDIVGGYRVLSSQTTTVVVTATTISSTVFTYVMPANTMGVNSTMRISYNITNNNNANAKTFAIRFNNTNVIAFSNVSTVTAGGYRLVSNRGVTASQVVSFPAASSSGVGTTGSGLLTMAIDTSANVTISATITLADGTDNQNLNLLLIELLN